MSRRVEKFVPVPQECMGLVIGKQGRNIKQLQQETQTRIRSSNEKESGFIVSGSPSNCDAAHNAIRRQLERWTKNNVCQTDEPSVASGSQNYSKHPEQNVERKYPVRKEYLSIILGPRHKNKESIETKSKTRITFQNPSGTMAIFTIKGEEQNCERAISLIRSCIVSHNEETRRKELVGNLCKRFSCFDFADEKSEFYLTPDERIPKLDGFIKGPRYRIETEDDYSETEVSDKTVSELKQHLLTSLNKLHGVKEEKELMIDLWCHFGKVFVHNVDEEEVERIITPEYVNRRLQKIVSPVKSTNKHSHWKVSFEEGVDSSNVNEKALPKDGVENDDSFALINKLVHTQWRYDFGFTTPSERNVRLKAWEGLPSETNEPPLEVKYILTNVDIRGKENIKAWLCYPSTTVLRGEILTPNWQYDCRMKLRAGSRYVTDKEKVCEDEDSSLADYLLNCKFHDAPGNRMTLPETKLPPGFECTFYREAEERMFSATVDGECFKVIVLSEKGWDSDSSTQRRQNQFGIRVVMNSWSEALLSHERKWEPERILDKLKDYMDFLSTLKDDLFVRTDC